jgi:hypothetical protein
MKKLNEAEEDALAMALMNMHGEMPEEVAADFTPLMLSVIAKLGLKPAIARSAAQLQATALALTAPAEAGKTDG